MNKHAQALGKKGGAAGRGAAKARTTKQASAAAQARWAKRDEMAQALSSAKFRVLQLESELAKAKRAQVSAEVDANVATLSVENRVREALEGAPTSDLWGPAGLIAATMRCVHALQDSEMPNVQGEPQPDKIL
jgi:hypothetical protein